ncbi:MAG: hypothetical protein RR365_08610 [Bacteroides sp.]
MKIIIKERGQGKTSELIRISADKQIPILCLCEANRRFIVERAWGMGIMNLPEPFVVRDLNFSYYKDGKEPILVDEVDVVLQTLLHRPIYAATITCPRRLTKSQIADMLCINSDELEIVD